MSAHVTRSTLYWRKTLTYLILISLLLPSAVLTNRSIAHAQEGVDETTQAISVAPADAQWPETSWLEHPTFALSEPENPDLKLGQPAD